MEHGLGFIRIDVHFPHAGLLLMGGAILVEHHPDQRDARSFVAMQLRCEPGQAREQEQEVKGDSFNEQLLQRYRLFLTTTEGVWIGTKLAARTINTYLASLRAFCTWLKRTNQIPYHPMKEVKDLKLAKRFVRDSLTEAEVARLMDTFDLTRIDPAAQERIWCDYSMTLLWVSTGTRSIELAREQRRHLAQRDGHPILYSHRKDGDAAEQPVVLAPWVLEALTAYGRIHDARHHPSGGPVEPFRGLPP